MGLQFISVAWRQVKIENITKYLTRVKSIDMLMMLYKQKIDYIVIRYISNW